MRLVFLGTPGFAVPTLEACVQAGHEVAAVLTQPDRPRGRGQNAAASPVKQAAVRLGLPVYQPERVRRPEAVEHLRGIRSDAMVVVGYGQIIPQVVIDLAPLGIINVHASLLPKYRGAGPIQWAIVRGETRTGVTTMRINAGLDTGDMLLKAQTEIGPEENAIELGQRLAVMGADLLVQTLAGLAAGSIVPEKQDDAQATLAPLLKKEDGAIDWTAPALAIHNRVRGLQPWPGARTSFRGAPLHLWKTRMHGNAASIASTAGRFVSLKPLVVACGEGALELLEVQLEGRKRINAADFANGQRMAENDRLGEGTRLKLPLGYAYAATYAGIRQVEKDDLALIVSGLPANAAAVFTQNRVQAAPVRLGRSHLKASKGLCGAVVINAGNANCATRTGDAVALATCKAAAKALKLPVTQVVPSSTGVIGVELDARKIVDALPRLVSALSGDSFDCVARAIMTTDLVPKTAFAEARLRRGAVRVAGMTKGSGMIQPMMATTLGFVMTDALIPVPQLRAMLKRGVERSYNRISVDGDTSTNDTLLLLANGASGVRPDPKEFAMVEAAITDVMESLAQQIARDGEGARKFVTIAVSGAPDSDAAARIARGIANSPLVKTAIAGSDPNWGRILSAAGNAGVAFDPSKTDIHMQGIAVCKGGLAAPFSEQELKTKLDDANCEIRLAIRGKGKGEARFWTCDLTEGYIRINASYRT